ncbi:hypothetical protein ABH922_003640 [Rhodococcus sp. 27YEA15]
MFGSLSTLGPLLTALGNFLTSVPTGSLSGDSSPSSKGGSGSLG